MNNNFYEIPYDWYSDFNSNYNPLVYPTNNNLANPKVALDRGNLFNNLYSPYRNYTYKELVPSNKREELLLNILRHNFVLTELDLYLDLNPTDKMMLDQYNKYLNDKKSLVSEYENKFGPLTLDGVNIGVDNWHYVKSPWPWEGTK